MKNRLLLVPLIAFSILGCSEPKVIVPIEDTVLLTSITLSNMTTTFDQYSNFFFDGIVTAHYSDESFKTVNYSNISSVNTTLVGNQNVTVSYQEKDISVSASYTINITKKQNDDGDKDDKDETLLPIGNTTVSGPKNISTPDDISNWKEYDLKDSLPANFSFIQGNNKTNNANFYQTDNGGLKFSHLYYGVQTCAFTPYKKVEVRLNISEVNNNSQKKKDGEPIFHIYGYNSSGKYIYTDYLNQGTITSSSKGNTINFYIRNINVTYFELRLNAFPYKSSQCYNFGINKISLKGWDFD